MASVNKVILVGNLGADPEVKSFRDGGQIATMRIATSENWKDRQSGERRERTEWHSIVIQSEGLIGVVQRYLRKGSKVYVEGQLRTRKWQAQDGGDRYSTEVMVGGPRGVLVMLDGTNGGNGQQSDGRGERQRGYDDRGASNRGGGGGWGGSRQAGGARDDWGSSGGGFADDLDDDIPFITDRSIW